MKTTKQVDNQFLKCLAFSPEDLQVLKETARKKGYTMPRFYHDAVLKGAALISASIPKENNNARA